MSRVTPCTWQLSCSPHVLSRVSAPGLGEAQEASPSRKASGCSPPAWLPGSRPRCHRCGTVLPSIFIWRQCLGRAPLLPFTRDYSCSRCKKVWAGARGRMLSYSRHPDGMLLLSLVLSSPWRFSCPCPSYASVSIKNSQSACMKSLLLKFYVAWSYLFRLVPNPPLQLIHLCSSPVTPIVLTVSPCR